MIASGLRILFLTAVSVALIAESAAAQSPRRDNPALARQTAFGTTALFEADIPDGLRAAEYNINNLGLFCGTPAIHPGRPVVYLYGFDYQRLQTGKPIQAAFDIDGKIIELTMKPFDDVVLAPIDGDFVRSFARAKSVVIQVKDAVPRPDRINLEHVETRVKSALKKCFKF
jgi:hypothetical protein